MNFIFSIFLLFINSVSFALTVPQISPLVDQTGLLTKLEKDDIEQRLLQLNNKKNIQIAIVVITSLEGENIFDFSMKVFNQWKLGSKELDNGLLVVLSLKEHKNRITVGQGLEGYITDVQSKRLLISIRHLLRNKEYSQAIFTILDGIEKITPSPDNLSQTEEYKLNFMDHFIIFLLGFTIIFGAWVIFKIMRNDGSSLFAFKNNNNSSSFFSGNGDNSSSSFFSGNGDNSSSSFFGGGGESSGGGAGDSF